MTGKFKFTSGDRLVTLCAILLVIFGSLMVASAEMGNSAGDTSYLTWVIVKQIVFALLGFVVYFILVNFRVMRLSLVVYWTVYVLILFTLLSTRFFGEIGGAYAWITIGNFATIQPSEFAKVFMIAFAGKLLGKDMHEGNISNIKSYGIASLLYVIIVMFYQHDLGSAVVLAIICYCCALIPGYKECRKIHIIMIGFVLLAIVLILFILSPPVTEFLKKHADSYMVGRFLAAANPFLYQYDIGYHVIMSLVSFANGGMFGLGYGNSIHKYMNFPNPSNDFILPVIVEELGFVGFAILVILYFLLLFPIARGSLKAQKIAGKIVMFGTVTYFLAHFILNIGGVGGLIPLTGVPLLMISSGGSSLMAALAALGLSQNELIQIQKAKENENNSGQV